MSTSKLEMNDLRDILKAAGLETFRNESYDIKRNAQRNLNGRTHYVDDDTLRFFHSRIVASGQIVSDTLFFIIESLAIDSGNTRRGFRGVVFDMFGTVVYRPKMYTCSSTSDVARRRMWAWLNEFDVAEHYSRALTERATRLEREAAGLRAAVTKIDEAA